MTHLWNATKIAVWLTLGAMVPALLSAQECGLQTLNSGYGFYYTSGVPGSVAYGVGAGVVWFDGAGKATSNETVSIGGTILRTTSSVTYTVNPNCTGTITWTYPGFGPGGGDLVVHADMVISNNGKTIYTIGSDTGSLSNGIYTRQ